MIGVIRLKKFNIKQKKLKVSYPLVFFLILVASVIFLPGILKMIMALTCATIFILWGYSRIVKKDSKSTGIVLLSPIALSAFQNVYLALGSRNMSSFHMEVLLSIHLLIIIGISVLVFANKFKELRSPWVFIVFFIITMQSILSLFFYNTPIRAFISSFRNIIACILVYIFTVLIGERVEIRSFFTWIIGIAMIVAIFGLIEWTLGLVVWRKLGIDTLWGLKGIPTTDGIPPNWFSSEYIGGHMLRRMVSTFADPVNLGSFLFASLMIAWYLKKRVTAIIILLCCILTVSKGALLGMLIFMVVFFVFKDRHKLFIPIAILSATVFGYRFLSYIKVNSTGSALWHILNFFRSFSVMFDNPFGTGVGNTGVMAGLSGAAKANIIEESGLGVINAQLGLIGAISFAVFFIFLFVKKDYSKLTKDYKVFYYSILASYIANMAFNEVALSPNSCSVYFIVLGLLNIKKQEVGNKNRDELVFKPYIREQKG